MSVNSNIWSILLNQTTFSQMCSDFIHNQLSVVLAIWVKIYWEYLFDYLHAIRKLSFMLWSPLFFNQVFCNRVPWESLSLPKHKLWATTKAYFSRYSIVMASNRTSNFAKPLTGEKRVMYEDLQSMDIQAVVK